MIFDAGSSGTRANVFRWQGFEGGAVPVGDGSTGKACDDDGSIIEGPGSSFFPAARADDDRRREARVVEAMATMAQVGHLKVSPGISDFRKQVKAVSTPEKGQREGDEVREARVEEKEVNDEESREEEEEERRTVEAQMKTYLRPLVSNTPE